MQNTLVHLSTAGNRRVLARIRHRFAGKISQQLVWPRDTGRLLDVWEAASSLSDLGRAAHPLMRVDGLALMAQLEIQGRLLLPARVANLCDDLSGLDPVS
jgi:hypothetical protein